ncbi:hypothetical protein CC80DRAFT_495449 [Byssothecium circinans]|uniref:Uncharacterized protein n=1 Tax=Byssothecium circinans TaxID=147558 RepID=A0A6A5TU07_9PLEO|nr:hypothetical protein CC80DRAFT_495449 [Byssothecium circinans]
MSAPTEPITTAPNTNDTQPTPRYTKAEKRSFRAAQKAAQTPTTQDPMAQTPQTQHGKRHGQKASQSRGHHDAGNPSINISQFNHLSIDELDTLIGQLALLSAQKKAFNNVQASLTAKPKVLNDRVTRDDGEKKTKVLSEAKLEKIQKRREMRAAKKAEWVAKKAEKAEKAAQEGASPAVASAQEPAVDASGNTASGKVANEDVINWDEE